MLLSQSRSVKQGVLYNPWLLPSREALFRLNSTQKLHSSCQRNSCSETFPVAKVLKNHFNPKWYRSWLVCGPENTSEGCRVSVSGQKENGRGKGRRRRRRKRKKEDQIAILLQLNIHSCLRDSQNSLWNEGLCANDLRRQGALERQTVRE